MPLCSDQLNENSAATTNVETATVNFLIFCFMYCLRSASKWIVSVLHRKWFAARTYRRLSATISPRPGGADDRSVRIEFACCTICEVGTTGAGQPNVLDGGGGKLVAPGSRFRC